MHGPRPICPKCGLQMGLALIEVVEKAEHDVRTFTCVHCCTELTETVRYKYSNKP